MSLMPITPRDSSIDESGTVTKMGPSKSDSGSFRAVTTTSGIPPESLASVVCARTPGDITPVAPAVIRKSNVETDDVGGKKSLKLLRNMMHPQIDFAFP